MMPLILKIRDHLIHFSPLKKGKHVQTVQQNNIDSDFIDDFRVCLLLRPMFLGTGKLELSTAENNTFSFFGKTLFSAPSGVIGPILVIVLVITSRVRDILREL